MRLTGSRAYYRTTPPKMPPGLVELIEGLTREVLKNNPSDIYGFCAGHVQQLLEIRDGPRRAMNEDRSVKVVGAIGACVQLRTEILIKKKTLTLEEKIVKAQEKVRQRAEKRRQQYNNDLLNRQSGMGSEIQGTPINKEDSPAILPQGPTAVSVLKNPTQIEQDLSNTSEIESSHEVCTPSEDSQHQEVKDLNGQDDVLKDDTKSEPRDTKCDSKSNTNLPELSNETSGNNTTLNSTLNELPKIDTPTSKVEMIDDFRAPIADEEMTNAREQSFKEDQKFVTDASALREYTVSTPNPEQDLSTPIKCDIGENVSDVLSQIENTSDVDDQNLIKQEIKVITNDIADTQSDNVTLPLNNEENKNTSQTVIPNVIDPDIINESNIDNLAQTTDSAETVNKNEEDLQESNTFDISFKESPTVELQDPQMNPDMLESLLETNTDSDIVTLLTQDSTETDLNSSLVDLEQNAFKHATANTELSEGYKDDSETNGIIGALEELEDNNTLHKTVTSSIDMIENNNKENDIDYNDDDHTSTKLNETPQIHNQDGNMDLETAAVTIQKVFRTFLFKSRASTFDDTGNDETMFLNETDKEKEECDFSIAASLNERRPHGLTRMDTVLQTVNEEKSLSLSTDDSSTMSSAATVIQAHVRGFLVRNKLNSNKTVSSTSLIATNSNEPSLTSLEMDNEQNKNKTVLNIHIVPEGGNYLSRDESLITSMDLSLDSSPPSSINLHPLGYDKSERRKRLKREDAIQSISPPTNNSGKLSEDMDSVKELPLNDFEITEEHQTESNVLKDDLAESIVAEKDKNKTNAENIALETIASDKGEKVMKPKESVEKMNSDEMDVVTPFISNEDNNSTDLRLMHSGEFHDAVLPTKVLRSDTTVASEFKNVLVYFLLWNHS